MTTTWVLDPRSTRPHKRVLLQRPSPPCVNTVFPPLGRFQELTDSALASCCCCCNKLLHKVTPIYYLTVPKAGSLPSAGLVLPEAPGGICLLVSSSWRCPLASISPSSFFPSPSSDLRAGPPPPPPGLLRGFPPRATISMLVNPVPSPTLAPPQGTLPTQLPCQLAGASGGGGWSGQEESIATDRRPKRVEIYSLTIWRAASEINVWAGP